MAGMDQSVRLSLQQALSPQMQSSLNVLQAPLMELRQLVQTELRENPTLEEIAPDSDYENVAESGGLQDEWREYFAQRAVAEPWTRESLERRQHFLDSQSRGLSLQEALAQQLATAGFDAHDLKVGAEIIGNLDESGFLRADVEDVAYAAGTEPLEVERVLEQIQRFDPPGIAARDLRECLLLQLQRAGAGTSIAASIVESHLDELARRRIPEIAKALGLTNEEVQVAMAEIAHLKPRPGSIFAPNIEQIITPEVVVVRDGDEFVASLTNEHVPRLRINDTYKDMLAGESREVRDYLRDKIKGGKFFIKSIQQRQQTILSIAREIVLRQRDFLENGPTQLRPMTMSQVAEVVGVHETTVSRAASGKYIATPQGIFEIKYFFTHGYTSKAGDSVSNESVRQAVINLVKEENPRHPYSDQDIVRLLTDQGLSVARRTVAKYRDQLQILPSHLRRTF